MRNFDVMLSDGSAPVKMWTRGVPVEDSAREQLKKIAALPFIYRHIAVMPDVHLGRGSTIGSVIPTKKAIIPAAVGVDIGCGMMAARTTLTADDLPDTLAPLRSAIESAVPHGRTSGGRSGSDRGAWGEIPDSVSDAWAGDIKSGFESIVDKHPKIAKSNNVNHLGTLGTGNHFVEVCLDEEDRVWFSFTQGLGASATRLEHILSISLKKKCAAGLLISLTRICHIFRKAQSTSQITCMPSSGRKILQRPIEQ